MLKKNLNYKKSGTRKESSIEVRTTLNQEIIKEVMFRHQNLPLIFQEKFEVAPDIQDSDITMFSIENACKKL